MPRTEQEQLEQIAHYRGLLESELARLARRTNWGLLLAGLTLGAVVISFMKGHGDAATIVISGVSTLGALLSLTLVYRSRIAALRTNERLQSLRPRHSAVTHPESDGVQTS